MPLDIGRDMDRPHREKRRAHDQGVDILKHLDSLMMRPGAIDSNAAPDGDIESAAQLLVNRRYGGHGHLEGRVQPMEALQSRDQPAHGEAGRRAHAQDPSRARPTAGFGRLHQAFEGKAHLGGEHAGEGGCGHPPAGADEKTLAKPALQKADLPADGAVGQAELRRRLGIAGRPRGDLEDAQGIQGWQLAHGNRDES